MLGALGDLHVVEQLDGARFGFLAGQALHELRDDDVFQRGKLRQQVVELVDEADIVAADCSALVVGETAASATVEDDVTGVRPISTAILPDGAASTCAAPDGATSATISPLAGEIRSGKHGQLALTLDVVPLDTLQFDEAPFTKPRSFVPQGFDRIEPSGAPSRKKRVARKESTNAAVMTTMMVSFRVHLGRQCERK